MSNPNLNVANTNNFQLVFTGELKDELAVSYFGRSVTLPGFSMAGASMNYQNADFSLPSNSRTKDELSVEFMVMEGLENYKFFRQWAKMGEKGEGTIMECLKDISLIFLDSSKNPVDTWYYTNAFPTNISPLTLEHGIVDAMPLAFTVSFAFGEEKWQK